MTIVRIFIGIALMGFGVFMVIKTVGFANFFGRIPWAEAKLGGGGTYLLYKFIGIIISFVGILVATNLWSGFVQAVLGSFLPGFGT